MNKWVWSIGGMILTGHNWSTGRKTLYSVGGRWMNEYGALVEWYWQGKTELLGEKPVPVQLYPPQISQVLARDRPQASEVSSRPLAASTSVIKCMLNIISFPPPPPARLTHNFPAYYKIHREPLPVSTVPDTELRSGEQGTDWITVESGFNSK
jgi:hypothetical protein